MGAGRRWQSSQSLQVATLNLVSYPGSCCSATALLGHRMWRPKEESGLPKPPHKSEALSSSPPEPPPDWEGTLHCSGLSGSSQGPEGWQPLFLFLAPDYRTRIATSRAGQPEEGGSCPLLHVEKAAPRPAHSPIAALSTQALAHTLE